MGKKSSRQANGRDPSRLSSREREVLALVSEGYLNREIAEELAISVRTVETYRERIMHKLDLHTVAELTRFAIAADITPS